MMMTGLQVGSDLHAARIRWEKTPYSHYANKEDIKTVLTDFFAAQGIGVVFSKKVAGTVSGKFENQDPRKFFGYIADTYNLIWYYDGAAVYLYSAHEMTSRILNLGYLDMKILKQNLIHLGLLDSKFALRMIEKERIIYISGPERYVQLVSEMAEQMDAKAMAQRGRDDIIKVFQLRYAWAEDKTIKFRDKQLTIPGVATLMRNLITGTTAPGHVVDNGKQFLVPSLMKLKGRGLAELRRSDDPDETGQGEAQSRRFDFQDSYDQGARTHPPSYINTDVGFVQADARQNAVVVRDRKEKMPYYENIINLLDAPVGLVEIRATIMDVDSSNLEDLGVEWEFAATDPDHDTVTKGGLNTTGLFSEEDGLQLPVGDGLNVATIIGDATDYFLSRVYALQRKGHAKILSRPSVLTLNNVEAQLEHSQTFYVRVAGDQEVDLFDINAGVILRVTPHIIKEKGHNLVKLAIQIEDGELSAERVDDIPVVKKSIVNTQAVVGQKESLLIGGYLEERNINSRQTVPCLGEVPILGWLFSKQSTTGREFERLFLITPTIVRSPVDAHTSNFLQEPKPRERRNDGGIELESMPPNTPAH
jgi:type III secretion protein C